jgi:hypothetical protein
MNRKIIRAALEEYKAAVKLFNNDQTLIKAIEEQIFRLDIFFHTQSITKDDVCVVVLQHNEDPEILDFLDNLSEEDMETLAHAMRTDDLPDSYWDNLADHTKTLFRKKCLEQESL